MFPAKHRQNDTLQFETKLDEKYNAFILTYYLNNSYSVAGSFNSTTGLFEFDTNDTDWLHGDYDVQGVATDGSSRFTVEVGKVEILQDLAQVADSSSVIKKTLDAINATLLGTASKDQESYEIAGRALKRRSLTELIMMKEKYEAFYQAELRKDNIANGGGVSGIIKVRF